MAQASHIAKALAIPSLDQPTKDPIILQLRQLVQTDEFLQLSTLYDQVAFIHERIPAATAYRIAKFFGVNQHRIDKQFSKLARGPGIPGRPPILSDEVLDHIEEMVHAAANDRVPLRISDISHYLAEHEGIDISDDTLRCSLRRSDRWTIIKLSPIEHDRQMVSDEDLAEYKRRLKAHVDNQPAAFVFNCDESGFDSHCDAKSVRCLLPPDADPEEWNFPVKRNEKRVTLVGCISAAGASLPPLCVTSRKTIDDDVLRAGYTTERVAYAYSPTGYITASIFQSWVEHIFIPHVEHLRESTGLFEQEAFLIMDNCTAHHSPDLDELFANHGITVIPLVPHSSHKTQQLDLGIFGNVKQAQSRIHPSGQASVQSQQLLRMLGAWVQITHPMAITSAFARSGVRTRWRLGRLETVVTDEDAKASRVDITEGLWPAPVERSVFRLPVLDPSPLVDESRSRAHREPCVVQRGSDFDLMMRRCEEVDSDSDENWEECEAEPVVSRKGRPAKQREEPGNSGWDYYIPTPRALPKGWATLSEERGFFRPG